MWSNNQRDWTPYIAVLLPPFITEAAILNRGTDVGELLKIFTRSVTERAEEGGKYGGDNDDKGDNSYEGKEAEEDK